MKTFCLLLILPLLLVACIEETGPQVETEKCGCTDEKAINFDTEATCSDNTCLYFDDDIKNVNILFSSTGCGACGVWGINCFEAYAEELSQLAEPLAVHFKYGDPMITPTNDSFVARIQPRHSPYYTVGTVFSQGRNGDASQICEESGENALKLLQEWKAEIPKTRLALGIDPVNAGMTKVHYAADVAGETDCRLSIYLLQDSMIYTQSTGWREYIEGFVHQHVLRESITNFSGVALEPNGDNYGVIEWPAAFSEASPNSRLLAIIWQKVEGEWRVLNAESAE